MIVPEILKTIGERLQSGATVKHVFGDPISTGDRTVIPVARVSYAFGGGGGGRAGDVASGGGGGGRLSATPAGVVEISPSGTRFIRFADWRKLVSIAVAGLAIGFLQGTRSVKR